MKDYYLLLGIGRNASDEEIRKAYRRALHRYHPDKDPEGVYRDRFEQVQQAFRCLSDPALRAEYDASLGAAAPASQDLRVSLHYSRSNIPRLDTEQVLFALLEVQSANVAPPERPLLNLCLVLDKSTSMKGAKMDALKASVSRLLRQLQMGDIFSIVAFNDYAEVILPAGYHSDITRAEARVHLIQASGGTEIYRGLEAGLQEVRRYNEPERVSQIVLLTDGRTYGDEAASLELAKRAAAEGIGISTLGLGDDWNDQFLDRLAQITGFSSDYVREPEQLERYFMREFVRLQDVYARNLSLDYFTGDHVAVTYLYRNQPDPLDLAVNPPVRLGLVRHSQPLQLVFEFHVSRVEPAAREMLLLSGLLTGELLSRPGEEIAIPIRIALPVHGESASLTGSDPKVLSALSKMSLYRLQERAREEAESGDTQSAARRLQFLAQHLLQEGERDLAKTALLEADHLLRSGQFSDEGIKSVKYGTRALLMAPKKEDGKP